MGFFQKLFGRKKKNEPQKEQETGSLDWEQVDFRGRDMNLDDAPQREKYVRFLLEQIGDAEGTLQALTTEYGVATSYLKDMEEITALPESESQEVCSYARKIAQLESDSAQRKSRESRISEEQYRKMERMESEAEEGIRKLRETENYRELIKKDLKRLDAERQAYQIRRTELLQELENSKGTSLICVSATAVCIIGLLIFQFAMALDTRIGYILIGLITALVLTFVYLRYHDASLELRKVENSINRLILLQNRVKIRYVNNTNLLDYLYMKYMTTGAEEMEKLYHLFLEEREERERYEKMLDDLSYYQRELIKILRRYQLYDPTIWIHQTNALLDSKEMVEIRHAYIGQRQKLRKQMEHNQELADQSKQEIKRVVEDYPSDAKHILAIVDEYDRR